MDFDAIVIGAGPAGALAARELARAGKSVGLFDADERDRINKSIIIELENGAFTATGTRPPTPAEIPYHFRRIRLFSPAGPEAFTIEDHAATAVRLDEFARRLTSEAVDAGAKFFGGYRCRGPVVAGGAVQGAEFETAGGRCEVKSRIAIDASGNAAVLTRRLAALGVEFVEEPDDRVVAANYFHALDPEAAVKAVRANRAADGEVWNRLGRWGNYSTVYSWLGLTEGRAYILVGHRADYPNPPMREIIDGFRREQGYYAAEQFGGGGLIRVRRSLDRLVAPGFMTIGEAACTVIPMHGSGVAGAMLTGYSAGRVAAAALEQGRTDDDALWPYAVEYQRGRGAMLAGQDASRRIAGSLSREHLRALIEDGGMQMEDMANALAPRPPTVSPGTVPARLRCLVKNPGLVPALAATGWYVKAAERHYKKYPARRNEQELQVWKRGAAAVFRGL